MTVAIERFSTCDRQRQRVQESSFSIGGEAQFTAEEFATQLRHDVAALKRQVFKLEAKE